MKTFRELVETYKQMYEESNETLTFYGLKKKESIELEHTDSSGRSSFYEITAKDHDGYRNESLKVKQIRKPRGKRLYSIEINGFTIESPYSWSITGDDGTSPRDRDTIFMLSGDKFQVEGILDNKNDYYPTFLIKAKGNTSETKIVEDVFFEYTSSYIA